MQPYLELAPQCGTRLMWIAMRLPDGKCEHATPAMMVWHWAEAHFALSRFSKKDVIMSPSILSADFAKLGEQARPTQCSLHMHASRPSRKFDKLSHDRFPMSVTALVVCRSLHHVARSKP